MSIDAPARDASRASRHACQPAASRAALPTSSKRLINVSTQPAPDASNSRRRVSSPSQTSSIADRGVNSTIEPENASPSPSRKTNRKGAPVDRSPTTSKGNHADKPSGDVTASQTFSCGCDSSRTNRSSYRPSFSNT